MFKEKKKLNGKYLAYVRVSSKDQEQGMSLEVQKERVESYARENNLIIDRFFGGTESAAKTGRKEFDAMMETLKRQNYTGIIFHKIDRAGRNPGDQGDLYRLMEQGHEFHFAHERYSTKNEMGRIVLYLLWAVASGFSENLKIEINKGLSGMLKNGRYPRPSPIGYIDQLDSEGKGDGTKIPDPERQHLIKELFKLYSTGNYDIPKLHKLMLQKGLTTKATKKYVSRPIQQKHIYKILRNSFYTGVMFVKGQLHMGKHKPLIDKQLFDKVQSVLDNKGFKHHRKFYYLFQHMIVCKVCSKPLRCMSAKGRYKYYSCRNLACKCNIREEEIDESFFARLQVLEFNNMEVNGFLKAVEVFRSDLKQSQAEQISHIDMELAKVQQESSRLLDLLLHQLITDSDYKAKKNELVNKEINLNEQKTILHNASSKTIDQIAEIGKLLKKPSLVYRMASEAKKVSLVKELVENFSWEGEKIIVNWKKQYKVVAERPQIELGSATGNRTPI